MPHPPPPPPPDNRNNFSDEEMEIDDDQDSILEVPDWVQRICQKSIDERKNNIRLIIQRENALKKLNEHMTKGTTPRSIIPTVKLHVSETYQQEVNSFMENIHKEYTKTIMEKLIEIRGKEVHDAQKMKRETFTKLRSELTTTMDQLRQRNGYDGNIQEYERDRKGYINIFRLEATEAEKSIRRSIYFKEKKRTEMEEKKRAERAEKQANLELMDPVQKQLQEIKDQLKSIQTNKNRQNTRVNHPNGQGRKGKNQPWSRQSKLRKPLNRSNNFRNTNRRNFDENWRNRNRNRNNNRNSNRNNRQPPNRQNQQNGQGNGNQGRHRRYTSSTNRLASNRRNYRQRRN